MPSNKAELSQRVAATQKGDAVRGLFFKVVMTLVQEHAGPEALRELRTAPLDKDYSSDLRSYPATDFLNLLYRAADVLESRLGPAEPIFRLFGEKSISSYSSSMGQLIFSVISGGDPHKVFDKAQMGYRVAVSYGERQYRPTSPKSGVLTVNGDLLPPQYHEGILLGSLKVLGLEGSVVARPKALNLVEYDILWK
jgi:uncharacterized protein (TIGR02265 family)